MNLGSNSKWVLLIGGIIVFAVCALLLGGGNLLRGLGGSSPVVTQPDTGAPVIINDNTNINSAQFGRIVTSRTIGEGNQPVDTTSRFSTSDRAIYAVASGYVPSGTAIFARWSRDGVPFEDTNEIVADRTYDNTNIEFHISPTNGAGFQPGNYTVQFFVNGNPGPQAQFTVS
jgi:hypothetical protein